MSLFLESSSIKIDIHNENLNKKYLFAFYFFNIYPVNQ